MCANENANSQITIHFAVDQSVQNELLSWIIVLLH